MSGTSMDGVDAAIIETDGQEIVTLGRTGFFPYAEVDRALLRRAIADAALLEDRRARPGCVELADAMITSRHVEAVEAFLAADSIDRATVDLIGFLGHTVLHRPGRRLTVQIGDGAGPAARLGIRSSMIFAPPMWRKAGRGRRSCLHRGQHRGRAAAVAVAPLVRDCLRRRRAQQDLAAGIGGPAALPGRFGGNLRLVERRHGSPGLRLSRGAAGEESAEYVSADHGGR
jgi:1,6-anhydro-N-acetylmuramate kinase